jgi:hypothetical protein
MVQSIAFNLSAEAVSPLTKIGDCSAAIVVFAVFEGFLGGMVAEVCFTEICDVHNERLHQRNNSLILQERLAETVCK